MGILLDNAVKYAEPGTEIGVTLRREGGSLSARVKPGGTIEFEARWKIART